MMRDDKFWPWVAGIAAALLYLSTHSYFYNFDGVACAIAVELGDTPHLVHGNHLAYGLVGLIFYRLWNLLGFHGPAIITLQALDSLLGGIGVGLFLRLCLNLGFKPRAAAIAAAGLGLSYAWWLWSLEAQVYALAAVGVLLTALEAFRPKPNPYRLGLYHALAALGHVGHLCLVPAAAYLLWTGAETSRSARLRLARYLLALGIAMAAAYAAAAIFIVRPRHLEDLRVWLLGSAALDLRHTFQWHGSYSMSALKTWGLMSLRMLVSSAAPNEPASAGARILSALALGAAALGAAAKSPDRRHVAAIGLWLAAYAALYISWEPFTMVYRMTDLIPIWLLIARALQSAPARWTTPLAAAWLACAFGFNRIWAVGPLTEAANNRAYQRALWVKSATPENSWIMAAGFDEVYIPYFARRKPLILRYYPKGRETELARRLDGLALSQERVFIASYCLEPLDRNLLPARYKLVERSAYGQDKLFELRGTETPGAKDRKN